MASRASMYPSPPNTPLGTPAPNVADIGYSSDIESTSRGDALFETPGHHHDMICSSRGAPRRASNLHLYESSSVPPTASADSISSQCYFQPHYGQGYESEGQACTRPLQPFIDTALGSGPSPRLNLLPTSYQPMPPLRPRRCQRSICLVEIACHRVDASGRARQRQNKPLPLPGCCRLELPPSSLLDASHARGLQARPPIRDYHPRPGVFELALLSSNFLIYPSRR